MQRLVKLRCGRVFVEIRPEGVHGLVAHELTVPLQCDELQERSRLPSFDCRLRQGTSGHVNQKLPEQVDA